MSATSCSGASAKSVRRRPSSVSRAELLQRLLDLPADRLPLLRRCEASSASICFFSAESPSYSLRISNLLKLAQGAQAHVEDRFGLVVGQRQAGHHDLLGLVLLADDADHLIDVEIGDQIAAEDFEPLLDLAEPVPGAADQHVLAVLQPSCKHALQRQDVRHLAARQHVHVERKAGFELGQLEQRFHQQAGIDRAALRRQARRGYLRRSRRARLRAAAACGRAAARRSSRSAAPSAPDRGSR